ncbi:GIY-YIG nuclease family protein [Marinobacterium rhizophilum]|uniref:GIY-YIG nuclease family protein n=1 Tax=Marinobacterium rhizophilum TaxID=420402 RepID=UPI0003A762D2|nr:GIY-YIG nuclease family protein [Marinobacterium rhizophilum]
MSESRWFVYILACADGSLYTGVTTDPQRRLQEHNSDNRLGARYTRARRPVSLLWHEQLDGRAEAQRREWQIKRMPRKRKLALIAG